MGEIARYKFHLISSVSYTVNGNKSMKYQVKFNPNLHYKKETS